MFSIFFNIAANFHGVWTSSYLMNTSCEGIVIVSVLQGIVVADVRVLRRAARRIARRNFCVDRRLPLQDRGLTLKTGG